MLNENEIQTFAKAIAVILLEEKEIELLKPQAEVEDQIASVLTNNMEEERDLNAACDKIMDQYAREVERGSVDPHKMFLMIKKKLAKEKGIVL